jgi:phage terminase small subunit
VSDEKSDRAVSSNLKPSHRAFVAEYVKDLNATRAYLKVFPKASPAAAATGGARLLRNAQVRLAVEQFLADLEQEAAVTVERLEQELARICFLDPAQAFDKEGRLLPIDEMPEDVRRALPGFDVEKLYEMVEDDSEPGRRKKREQVGETVKVRWPSKTEAIKLFLQRRGALTEKVDVTVRTHADLVAEAARRAVAAKPGGAR